jgi:hypothetical protein
LGRPANIASKLTDVANKPQRLETVPSVSVAYQQSSSLGDLAGIANPFGGLLGSPGNSSFGGGLLGSLGSSPFGSLRAHTGSSSGSNWRWVNEPLEKFISNLEVKYFPSRLMHKDVAFESFVLTEETR